MITNNNDINIRDKETPSDVKNPSSFIGETSVYATSICPKSLSSVS